ncbi:MAG: hypothetical protein JZU50_07450, partial [Desulfobulbaceae bacterium]|nr:hypothetical protein [Desulfobulbaceae bacterium]
MLKKIVVMEMSKTSKAVKTLAVARPGSTLQATPDSLYQVLVDGVQLTSKNATFKKKGGRLIVEKDGEVVVDFDYGTAADGASADVQVTDGWSSFDSAAVAGATEAPLAVTDAITESGGSGSAAS